ncbi:hypothetical protein CYMTET_25059 [Cymbomonas tetramitiformis]|uniref:Uncharacterized protein n=1 Tax=Cymbomonas tetramitiformis TaxID=36881 RepID=A0AAE0FUY2_9CHLO|nr:hypothetical protein CYMTET_25059 [Cymbomonas tetramitiformis]
MLQSPASSSEYTPDFGPENAVTFDPSAFCGAQSALNLNERPFSSSKEDPSPWWCADLPENAFVSHVQVFGDMRQPHLGSPGNFGRDFEGVVIELLDKQDNVLFATVKHTVGITQSYQCYLTVAIPGSLYACKVRVRRSVSPDSPRLTLSLVRCFGEGGGADGEALKRLLLLARHGQAEHNVGMLYDPIVGPGLTPAGQRDAAALPAKIFGLLGVAVPSVILVSPQRRALETAAIARATDPRLRAVPLFIQRNAYEHSWTHQRAQVPPSKLEYWPAGTEQVVQQDTELVAQMERSLNRVEGDRGSAEAPNTIAPVDVDARGAFTRAGSILNQLRARADARLAHGETAEPIILLIAHGGINHDVISNLEPLYSPFMAQHHQTNGDVKGVGLPF